MSNIIYIPKPIISVTQVKYGFLYNYYAITDSRNIASDGWHAPTDADWTTLTVYLNNDVTAGGRLKESGFTYWESPNTGATNEVGFNARGSGNRYWNTGIFSNIDREANFWSTTWSGYGGWTRYIFYTTTNISRNYYKRTYGLPVRLVKDSTILTHGQTGTYIGNDGKIYRTICINNQEWLADNLCETKYRDNSWITGFDNGSYTIIDTATWIAKTTEAMCAYNDLISNAYT